MRSHSSVVVLVWLVGFCCDVTGFTIRRRSNEPHSDLSQAFRVLQRQRRRINEMNYLASSRLPDPREQLVPSDLSEWEQGVPSREDEEWLRDAYGLSPYGDDSFEPEEFIEETNFVETPAAQKEEPSKEELEDIFDESDGSSDTDTDASDKGKDVEDGAEDNPAVAQTSDPLESENGELEDLTEDEFKALMSAVEKLQKKALAKKDTKQGSGKPIHSNTEDVSKEELKEVFAEDDDKDDTSDADGQEEADIVEEVMESTGAEEPEEAVNTDAEPGSSVSGNDPVGKYWMLDNILNSNEKRKKRFTKRAPILKPPNSVPLEETYLQEIQRLRQQIQELKLMTQVEDMENDALTQTLNEATMSQMEGSVSEKEFQSLQNAINLEEALQDLRKGQVNPLILELLAADAVGDLDKRGEPLWKKKVKRMDANDLEESYPMYTEDKKWAAKRQEVFAPVLTSKKSPIRTEVERWYETPVSDERKEEQQHYLDAQDAIEALVTELEESKVASDDEEDEDEEDVDTLPSPYIQDEDADNMLYPDSQQSQTGVCPSVTLLTDCKFADQQNLPIDDEARDLCNRHEMCYECGATTGVKQGECDGLYRAQARALCDGEADCVIEAERFLRELKLKHRYSTFYEPTCDNSCTADYIGL